MDSLCSLHPSDDVFTAENRAVFKKLFSYAQFKDQKCLYDQFVQVYKEIKIKLFELNKMSRNEANYGDIRVLAIELG